MWILSFAFLWEAIISDSVSSGPLWHEGRGRQGESREDLLSQPWKGRGEWPMMEGEILLLWSQDAVPGWLPDNGVSSLCSLWPQGPLPTMTITVFSPGLDLSLKHRKDTLGEERAHCQCSKRTDLMASETIASPWAFLMINPSNAHTLIDAGRVNKKLLNISISFPFFLVQTGQSLSLLLIKDSRNRGND